MPGKRLKAVPALAAMVVAWAGAASADDNDALALESAAPAAEAGGDKATRLLVEGALGREAQRHGLPDQTVSRVSLDLSHSQRLRSSWRLGFSDRLDYVDPAAASGQFTVNSLREVYVGWQNGDGSQTAELGRVNWRNGPAYGYNPTDYFRETALRTITTVDPLALRENRLGTVMLRFQQLWPTSAVSLAIAPRLSNAPSSESFSPDWGATNRRHRALATWSGRSSDRFGGQLLAFYDDGIGGQLGANATALLGDALVAHGEISRGKDEMALSGTPARLAVRNRLSAGATYTTSTRLALTAEYEYNGFAADQAAWTGATPEALRGYLIGSLSSQEIASRRAWLLYANQKSALWKNLDVSALLRLNMDDESRMGWVELRYHWPQFDAALQWQANRGPTLSEFGLLPTEQSIRLVGAWYF